MARIRHHPATRALVQRGVGPPASLWGSMANIKSQIKRNRQNETRRARNKAVKSELKTRVKRVRQAAADGSAEVADLLREAQKRLDMAAAKGTIHKNQAARRKSRLARAVARTSQGS